ncbi:unnamed protein product [Ranitomeya imitator]|uniref:GCS light chain n=1 Tax=Ranitomeya imitator TaxID=111125 RepID=A0ABN9L8I7_9NEOB|nr:unnamed protein product [Ranitomeya imitator]
MKSNLLWCCHDGLLEIPLPGRAKYACAGAVAEDQKRTSWKEDRRRRSGPETPIRPDQQRDRPWSESYFCLPHSCNLVPPACSTLAVTQLDSVIIAPPPLEDGVTLTLEHLQPYWRELESLVQDNKVVAIGTSDLDKPLLEQLYLWAQIKPSSNQVNLASCCIMPPDLTAFAKQLDIQLLTHSDSKEILSEESFQDALKEGIQGAQVDGWSPEWVLRYSVIVKTRGIIKSKGYIIQAQRKAPH